MEPQNRRRTQRGWRVGALVLQAAGVLTLVPAHASELLDCLIEPFQIVELSSSEIGVLGTINVEEADAVEAGEVLATLHNDVERASLDLSRARAAAEAELELLRQDHEYNERKRHRVEQLKDQLAVSAQSADEVRKDEELARLRLNAAVERQQTLRLEARRDALSLKRRTVRSPISGVVAKRYKSVGEYVDGDPIVQLAQLDPLRIRVVAPISMYGQIRAGMSATVLPELDIDGSFEASVSSVDAVMDAATATFGVRLSLPNPGHRLPPGLRCSLVMQEPRPVATAAPPVRSATATSAAATRTDTASLTRNVGSTTLAGAKLDQPRLGPVGPHTLKYAAPDQCATLGPFSSDDGADALADVLAAKNVTTQRRYLRLRSTGPRWVVVSALSDQSTSTLQTRIRQANVKDYQLLRKGPWKNRFSFGAYTGEQSARHRVRALSTLGFNVELKERENTNATVWLDVTRAATDPVVAGVINGMDDKRGTLTAKPIPCAQLASR